MKTLIPLQAAGKRGFDLFQLALPLKTPWRVQRSEFEVEEKRLDLYIDFHPGGAFAYPGCGRRGCTAHDTSDKERLRGLPGIRLLEPLGYLEFLDLMENAGVILTDSGRIQEETTFLGVPCLTLRENTERPATITSGTNDLVKLEPEAVAARVRALLDGGRSIGTVPPLWDGRAAERVVEVLEKLL